MALFCESKFAPIPSPQILGKGGRLKSSSPIDSLGEGQAFVPSGLYCSAAMRDFTVFARTSALFSTAMDLALRAIVPS